MSIEGLIANLRVTRSDDADQALHDEIRNAETPERAWCAQKSLAAIVKAIRLYHTSARSHLSKRNVALVAPRTPVFPLSFAAASFFPSFPGLWMFLVPPGIVRPIDRRTITPGRAAFQPELRLAILPDAHGVAVKTFAAV